MHRQSYSTKKEQRMSCKIYFLLTLLLTINLVLSQCPIQKTTTVLDLTSKNIFKLQPKCFGSNAPKLEQLQAIDLSYNRLETIENASFFNVPQLAFLNMSNNDIKHLPAFAFRGLVKLVDLNLRNNRLTTIDWSVFEPRVELAILKLRDNLLINMTSHRNVTLKIKELDVASNKLADISGLRYLPDLKVLRISENPRLPLVGGTFFENPALETLDLSRTGLKADGNFEFLTNVPDLRYLYLDNNDLAGFDLEMLPDLRRLGILGMKNCKLDTLDIGVLCEKFPRLSSLDVTYNRFGCFYKWHMEHIKIRKGTDRVPDFGVDCVFNMADAGWLLAVIVIGILMPAGLYFGVRAMCHRRRYVAHDYELPPLHHIDNKCYEIPCTETGYVHMKKRESFKVCE